jgi:APA family basic amino acid/polyamine antiporter
MGAAMLAALWAFDGWNNMPMAAGEVKDPGRVIPRALGLGTLAVLALYGAVNLAYVYALPFGEILSSNSNRFPEAWPVATKAAETVFGAAGVMILSAAFIFSALGAMNGSILTGARVPYAMAKDKLFFSKLAAVHPRTHVPVTAIVVQGVWAGVLALSGTFDQLTDYVVFASWAFYALVTSAVFVLRRRAPNAHRPFKTPGYPWLPCAFIAVTILLLGNTAYSSPRESGVGLALIALGVPFYWAFRKADRLSAG